MTDEYIDLAARAMSQKQLEQQYLEILKRAVTVKDALEVQKQLAEVRTEIERMVGRQHLLDKESAFSTLTVQLINDVPKVAVSAADFGGSVRRAWSDAQSLSADLISGCIRALGLLFPVLLLVVMPITAILWISSFALRLRSARKQRKQAVLLAS